MKTLAHIAAFFFGFYLLNAQQIKNDKQTVSSQSEIPVVIIEKNSSQTSTTSEFVLKPLEGYDATTGKMSVSIEELLFYYDGKDLRKTKIRGVIDLNCCFGMIVRVDILDENDLVTHTITTNEKGQFRLLTPYGHIAVLNKNKAFLRFAKLQLFDMSGNTHTYVVAPSKIRPPSKDRR